jgi:hypothetical protein
MQALDKNTVAAGMRIGRKLLFLLIFCPSLAYFISGESITKPCAANKQFFGSTDYDRNYRQGQSLVVGIVPSGR